MSTTYKSGFFGNFKLGDNVVYNLKILRELYNAQSKADENAAALLRKPIIVLIAAVAEAILWDLCGHKIKKLTSEGVENISEEDQTELRNLQKFSEMNHFICQLGNYKVFKKEMAKELYLLCLLRGRIHIQNEKDKRAKPEQRAGNVELDDLEEKVWTSEHQKHAEQTLEKLIVHMIEQHLREPYFKRVEDLVLPWNSHLKNSGDATSVQSPSE